MKKYYLSLLCIILYNITLGQHSQYFQLTPSGFKTVENTDYLVIQKDGSASELYNNILLSIGRRFNSPKDVVSLVQDKQIKSILNCFFVFGISNFKSLMIEYWLIFCLG